jgi:D-3-phosphoglycerate dehydrogenase
MQSTKPTRYLIDFDSTFIQSEGLDVLAELSLEKHSDKESIVNQIKYLTQQGMEGKISFAESLRERVALLQTNRQFIKQAAQILKKHISPSIQRNKAFFQEHKNQIYIISGGFHELIQPVVKSFGIPPKHIFANTFTYNDKELL